MKLDNQDYQRMKSSSPDPLAEQAEQAPKSTVEKAKEIQQKSAEAVNKGRQVAQVGKKIADIFRHIIQGLSKAISAICSPHGLIALAIIIVVWLLFMAMAVTGSQSFGSDCYTYRYKDGLTDEPTDDNTSNTTSTSSSEKSESKNSESKNDDKDKKDEDKKDKDKKSKCEVLGDGSKKGRLAGGGGGKGSGGDGSTTPAGGKIEAVEAVLGTPIDMDGAYGAQCWDFANWYAQKLGAPGISGGSGRAGYIGHEFPWESWGFEVIKDPSASDIKPGDIICWYPGGSVGAFNVDGTYGHVGVIAEVKENGAIDTYEQNAEKGQIVERYSRQFVSGSVSSVIRKKG